MLQTYVQVYVFPGRNEYDIKKKSYPLKIRIETEIKFYFENKNEIVKYVL